MAQSFDKHKAKELIEKYKYTILEGDEILFEIKRSIDDIRTFNDEANQRNICSKRIEDRVLYNNENNELPTIAVSLIQLLGRLKPIFDNGQKEYEFVNENNEKIKQAVKDLAIGTSGLRWFFSSGEKKRKAKSAFDYLSVEVDQTFSNSVQKLMYLYNDYGQRIQDNILTDFETRKDEYKRIYYQLVKNQKTNSTSKIVSELMNQYHKTCEDYTDLNGLISQMETLIINSAKKLRNEEAVKTLKGVSIDEINRDRQGFRIKALKDAGYVTIGDLVPVTSSHLSSIHGISVSAADSIKEKVQQMLDMTIAQTKISLHADKKTKNTTELISYLYIGKLHLNAAYELKKKYELDHKGVDQAANCLLEVGSGMQWLFMKDQEKNEYVESYDVLKQFLSHNYSQKLVQRNQSIQGKHKIDPNVAWKDFEENSVSFYTLLEKLMPELLGSDQFYGLPEDLAKEIDDQAFFPDGLTVQLRNYQVWGVKYALHQERILLGDEMGLGKTVQAIATMVSLRNTGCKHFLVVCPASVLINWSDEVQKHSKLRPIVIHGQSRSSALKRWMSSGGVGITTYETTGTIQFPSDMHIDMLVVDEAHYIKNPQARRSKNVKLLSEKSDRIMFMTGTALENKVNEMVNLIDILNPAIAAKLNNISYMSTAPQFRETVAPVYYRRKKEEVLTELPDLIESIEWCQLGKIERSVYEEDVLAKKYADIRRVSWSVDDLKYSSKGKRLAELVEEATSDNRNVIVFSFFLDTMQKVRKLIGDKYFGFINGSVPAQKREGIVKSFNQQKGKVLLAQIQAGGTGLNIQGASVVIFCEPQLKPSLENQAVARAYRMGQTNSNVLVYRLMCPDSIDEKIMNLLQEKQSVFDAFADRSVAADNSGSGAKDKEIDQKTFSGLIQEEIDRITRKNQHGGNDTQNKTRKGKIDFVSDPDDGFTYVSASRNKRISSTA